MAVLMGLAAVLYIRTFYLVRDKYRDLPIHPQLKPLTGALCIGVFGMFFPQVMGDGYSYMKEVLDGGGIAWVMFALVFLKMIATSITLGSGGAGGVFAPSLFIGAMLGGTFGSVIHKLLPDFTAGSGAYATVGIGAFLAATTHAPMTAIFLLFEMTGNYQIILPIMITSIIGTIVAKKFCEDSIDTVDFTREGIDIHEGRETVVMKSLKVGSAISHDVDFISEEANIKQLLQILSIGTPDDSLFTAMQLFDIKGIEEIPVVESLEDRWVVGMLKRRDALDVYNRQVLKKGINAKIGGKGVSFQ